MRWAIILALIGTLSLEGICSAEDGQEIGRRVPEATEIRESNESYGKEARSIMLNNARKCILKKDYEIAENLSRSVAMAEEATSNEKAEACNHLGSIYTIIFSEKKRKVHYVIARSYFQRAVSHEEDNDVFYNNLGCLHIMAGEYDEALKMFKKAKSLNPESPNAALYEGHAYFLKNDYKSAVRCFEEAEKNEQHKEKAPILKNAAIRQLLIQGLNYIRDDKPYHALGNFRFIRERGYNIRNLEHYERTAYEILAEKAALN